MNPPPHNPVGQTELEHFRLAMTKLVQCCQEQTAYRCERFQLSDAEQRCLLQFGQDRYLTAKSLTGRLGVAKSRVTRIVAGLAGKGLVDRSPDPADTRYHLLSLTAKGRAKRDELEAFLKGMHAEILAQLQVGERKDLLSSLERLRFSMESLKESLE